MRYSNFGSFFEAVRAAIYCIWTMNNTQKISEYFQVQNDILTCGAYSCHDNAAMELVGNWLNGS